PPPAARIPPPAARARPQRLAANRPPPPVTTAPHHRLHANWRSFTAPQRKRNASWRRAGGVLKLAFVYRSPAEKERQLAGGRGSRPRGWCTRGAGRARGRLGLGYRPGP